MAITAEQRKERKNHLGSSDIPAILGFSKWATAYDVWLEKTGRVATNDESTDYQEAGNILETSVLEWAQKKEYVSDLQRDPEIAVPGTPIVVHIDAVETESGNPVEVKTEGLYGPLRGDWGDAGSDEIPKYTFLQCQAHMMATDREITHVPTFLGGRGFGYFYCERDEGLVKLITEEALRFWNENVLADVAPDAVPSLDMIKKIRRVEGEPVTLADELIEAWLEAKEAAKECEQEKQACQARILAALDGHQEGLYGDGMMITNYVQSRKEYVCKSSTFRVMRSTKVKVK